MSWREKWIFIVFGRVLVARWSRRVASTAFISMLVFALSAVVEQLGYVQDRLASPQALCYAALGSFALAVSAVVTGAYASHRRVPR